MDIRSHTLNAAEVSNHLRQKNQIEELQKKADALLNSKEFKDHNSENLSQIGLAFILANKLYEAENCFTQTLLLEQESFQIEIVALSHYGLAIIKKEKNQLIEALKKLELVKSLTESNWLKAHTLLTIGKIYLTQNNFQQAQDAFYNALDFVLKEPSITKITSVIYHHLGMALIKKGLIEKNEDILKQGLQKFDVAEHTFSLETKMFLKNSADYEHYILDKTILFCEAAESFGKDYYIQETEKCLANLAPSSREIQTIKERLDKIKKQRSGALKTFFFNNNKSTEASEFKISSTFNFKH